MSRSTNTNLGITILGDYKGGPAFKTAAADASRLDRTVTGLTASVKDYVIGFGAVAGVGWAFDEAEEAKASARSTAEAIRSTGNAAQVSAKQQADLVDQLSQLAGLDDEIVNGGANMLRTFTSIKGVDIFGGALASSLDLAAKFGSVDAAAVRVGKALNDPIAGLTSLNKAGIQFSATQKQVIRDFVEAGDKASAQRIILKELETQFGGQAEAAATSSGKIKVALGNTAESIGTVLLPALDAAATGVGFVADAFNTLPKGAQAATLGALGLAYVAPKIASGFKAASDAIDFFKLGLAGATEKGAGFSNALGGMISKAGGLGAIAPAAGVAGVALTALAATFLYTQAQAEHAKNNVKALVQEIEGGADPLDAFRERLARTLASADGGFEGLNSSSKEFRKAIDEVGIGTDELADALTGSDKQFENLKKRIREALAPNDPGGFRAMSLIDDLEELRVSGKNSTAVAADLKEQLAEVGLESDDTAEATANLGAKIRDTTTAMDRYNAAVAERRSKLEAQRDAQEALADAHDATVAAMADETAAREAAKGNSDEYRAAVKKERDDLEALADAEAEVTDAKDAALEARQDLNDAYAEAEQRLQDLREAVISTAAAERDARTAAKRAAEDERKVNADITSTALDKEEAHNATLSAQEEAARAAREAADAQRESAAAQAAGVEGDQGVIDAKKRLVQANEAVIDAEDAVKEKRAEVAADGKAKSKILADAAAALEKASEKSRDAQLDEAEAVGKLGEAYGGASAGVLFQIAALEKLRDTVAPGSPLRTYLDQYIEQLRLVVDPSPSGVGSLGSSAPPGAVNAERQDRAAPRAANDAAVPNVTTNIILQDQPRAAARRAGDHAKRKVDEVIRGGR